jgi:hypothetical protein
VRGTEGASWKYKRPRFVVFGFQVSQHAIEAQREVASNVLTKKPAGPAFGKQAAHLWPEPAVIFRAAALPGIAEGLARVAGGNNVGALGVADIVDIEVLVGFGEVAAANRIAKRVDVASPDGGDAGLAGG